MVVLLGFNGIYGGFIGIYRGFIGIYCGFIGIYSGFNGICNLVGGWPTPLKNMSQLDDDIPNIWKNKTCSKPPTRIDYHRLPKTYIYIHVNNIVLQNSKVISLLCSLVIVGY